VRRLVPKAQVRVAQIALRTLCRSNRYTVITAHQAALRSGVGFQFLVPSNSQSYLLIFSLLQTAGGVYLPETKASKVSFLIVVYPSCADHSVNMFVNRYKHWLALTA
jgi:hypothetical protein